MDRRAILQGPAVLSFQFHKYDPFNAGLLKLSLLIARYQQQFLAAGWSHGDDHPAASRKLIKEFLR